MNCHIHYSIINTKLSNYFLREEGLTLSRCTFAFCTSSNDSFKPLNLALEFLFFKHTEAAKIALFSVHSCECVHLWITFQTSSDVKRLLWVKWEDGVQPPADKKRNIYAGRKVSPAHSFSVAVFAIDRQHFCRERHGLSEGLLNWRRLTVKAASAPQHFFSMFDVAHTKNSDKAEYTVKPLTPGMFFLLLVLKKKNTKST